MRPKAIVGGLARVAAASLAASSSVASQASDEQRWPPTGVSFHGDPAAPDISGLWLGTMTGVPGEPFEPNRGPMDGRPATYLSPWPLPYTPAYQKIYDQRLATARAGRALGDVSAQCRPFGMPFMLLTKAYPDEIVQTPGAVTFLMNNTFPVVIWTDGRGHPADWTPSYNGHSIGHWVGDTLFVDTVGIKGTTPLTGSLWPHSEKLHIEWSIRRVAPDFLYLNIMLHDEDAFTQPVVTTQIWQRKTDPQWQILDDASCFENNRENIDAQGVPGFPKF